MIITFDFCYYKKATQNPPWFDKSVAVIMRQITNFKSPLPQLPPGFSDEVINFVDACFKRDYTIRPSAAQLLTHNYIVYKKEILNE